LVLNPVQTSVLPNHIPSLFATVFDPQVNVSGVPKERKSAMAVVVQENATTTATASMRNERKRIGCSPWANRVELSYFVG
jgi:hypothetical protein